MKQRRVKSWNGGSPPDVNEAAQVRNSRASRKRADTGAGLENMLAMMHRFYEYHRIGRLHKQNPPFKRGAKGWFPVGAAGVDYVGHVCARVVRDQRARDQQELDDLTDPTRIEGVAMDARDSARRVYPIAFDAKVLKADHSTYKHDVALQHQLLDLRDEARAGVSAFLLIHAPKVERVFILPIANHFDDLLSGRGVTLYETVAFSAGASRRGEIFPLVPSVGRLHAREPMLASPGAPSIPGELALYDWIPLLKWCPNGYDSPST